MIDRRILPCACLVLFSACSKLAEVDERNDEPFVVELPSGLSSVPVPAENEPTVARVTLGKKLFFDDRLSMGIGISCASCHHPDRAFSDTLPLSLGKDHASGLRNSPTLANLAWHPAYFRDGGVPTLEVQVLAPLHEPVEMASNIQTVVELLRDEEPYASLSMKGYGRVFDGYVLTRAIACYERTLVSGWSRFDRYFHGSDASALTEAEVRGWQVFSSEAAGCAACHSGHDLTDHSFRNIGTSLDHTQDPGRERITLDPSDRGKFKVPTLRNIALTGPYMHDGSMTTLEQVIDHFIAGGVVDPNKDPLVRPLTIDAQQRADLLAFLRSLTDERSLDQVP